MKKKIKVVDVSKVIDVPVVKYNKSMKKDMEDAPFLSDWPVTEGRLKHIAKERFKRLKEAMLDDDEKSPAGLEFD